MSYINSLRNEIILQAVPRGVFLEGVVSGTPKPGTIMQISSISNGVITWGVFDRAADGDRALIAILLPNDLLGQTIGTAYVSGDRCKVYVPAIGETVQVLFGDTAGTADDVAVGNYMIIDDGTGKVIATTGSPQSEPFVSLEAIVDPVADQLLAVIFTGM